MQNATYNNGSFMAYQYCQKYTLLCYSKSAEKYIEAIKCVIPW